LFPAVANIYNIVSSCGVLVDAADDFIVRNFERVVRQSVDEFCRQVDEVGELEAWLRQDSLFVDSESFLLQVTNAIKTRGEFFKRIFAPTGKVGA
jgi:hypothetical protein